MKIQTIEIGYDIDLAFDRMMNDQSIIEMFNPNAWLFESWSIHKVIV